MFFYEINDISLEVIELDCSRVEQQMYRMNFTEMEEGQHATGMLQDILISICR